MSRENELIVKLDRFIRKYYKNRLMRGGLWVCALLAAFFLVLVMMEYFFRFNQTIRTFFFFSFLGIALFTLARLVFVPLMQLMKIGKILSYDQAATIIGQHFSEIQDKLLNTLQLIEQQRQTGEHSELIEASIEQKTSAIRVFRFNVVIDFRKNLKYLRYAAIPVLLILAGILFSPKTISDPTKRILHFNQAFIKPLPFKIELANKNLSALQQEDFEVKVNVTGEEIPVEIFIRTRELNYKMTRGKGFAFEYVFKSLQCDMPFKICAGEYQSQEFVIKVFPKPIILSFDVSLDYPAYINKPGEHVENIGDFSVPEGTVMSWNFHTRDVSSVKIRMGEGKVELAAAKANVFTYTSKILKSFTYCISPFNANTYMPDSLAYRVTAIGDGYPSVFVNESVDSAINTTIFYKGTIKDDYGFSKLTFNYSVYSKGDSTGLVYKNEPIVFDKSANNQVFYYTADLLKLMPMPGMNIKYYFEVWDNDGIHGPKCTRSELKTVSTPSINEISVHTGENEHTINQELEKSISDSKAMKKNMEELNKKLVDQNTLSWQEKKKIEDLIKENAAIERRVEEIKKKTQENLKNEEKFLGTSERIIEKQKQLNDLMDKLLTDEMKKMIEEMKALLNQVDKTKLADLLEKMKMSNKELETELDRNLSLMKQMEFDRKLEEMVKDLKKAAEEQEKLAEATEKDQKPKEELLKEQEKIRATADSLAKKIEALEKQGKELESPANLGNTGPKKDSIGKNLAESEKKIKEGKSKEAAGSQKKAARQMKELAQQMEDSQEESEESQLEEDASNIRMILENLVRLSFDQEDLIGTTRVIVRSDPRYPEIVYRQKEFSEKLKVVEDSLQAIAKRQVMIKSVVTKEIAAVNLNIKLALDALDSRNINLAVAKQQYSMTSLNNLALLLNESLEQMNQKMNMSMKSKAGSKQCKNPSSKGGKMSAKSMKDMQQKIGQQLEKLKSGMEGQKKPGMGNKQEQSGMNREIAKLAAQQEALRNEMQKYQDNLGTKGKKDQGSLNEAGKEMEQIEKDLVNKNISQETMMRQQRILSRLLESEKAEQTRDQEEKRESTEAKNQQISNPGLNYQYNMKKRASQDNIQLILPVLNSYYKTKVNSYIVKIEH